MTVDDNGHGLSAAEDELLRGLHWLESLGQHPGQIVERLREHDRRGNVRQPRPFLVPRAKEWIVQNGDAGILTLGLSAVSFIATGMFWLVAHVADTGSNANDKLLGEAAVIAAACSGIAAIITALFNGIALLRRNRARRRTRPRPRTRKSS